jgi:hypothetical protein
VERAEAKRLSRLFARQMKKEGYRYNGYNQSGRGFAWTEYVRKNERVERYTSNMTNEVIAVKKYYYKNNMWKEA